MKKILLSLVALICATVSFAQSQIATLTHGDEIKTFYGYDSFAEAMKVANDGDIISLSSGYFKATDITKAITLRGAGMVELNDEFGYQKPSLIEGALQICIPDETTQSLVLEGLKFNNAITYSNNLKKPLFKKCNIFSLTAQGGSSNTSDRLSDAQLIGCRIKNGFSFRGHVTCFNCIIYHMIIYKDVYKYPNYNQSPYDYAECTNCIIKIESAKYSSFKNCYLSQISRYIGPTNIVTNCVGDESYTLEDINDPSNKICKPVDFFKGIQQAGFWDSFKDDFYKFVLTEDAATTYLGDDGTQIGIYGGVMPYDEHTILPKITKCNVANKSTADGKLSVDIQVEAAQ